MQLALRKAMVLALWAGLLAPGCSKQQAQPAEATQAGAVEQAKAQTAKAAATAKSPKLTRANKFVSPRAVFDAGKAAILAKDFGRFVDCVSPKSRKGLAAGMVMMLGLVTTMAKDSRPQVEAMVKKHGIPDAEAMKQWKGDKKEVMERLQQSIKDPRALVVDAMALFERIIDKQRQKMGKKGTMPTPAEKMVVGELVDLEVDGDQATAKLKKDKGPGTPMQFTKVDGSWYLVIEVK